MKYLVEIDNIILTCDIHSYIKKSPDFSSWESDLDYYGYEELEFTVESAIELDEDGIPYDRNTFDEVIANNILCQISSRKKFVFVMNELFRVIKPNGILKIRVPNASDICAFQDSMDTIRFTNQSFTYMEDGHRRYETYGRLYGYKPPYVS